MEFPLSSSLVLGVAVVLWLLWVAPQLMRRRQATVPFVIDSPFQLQMSTERDSRPGQETSMQTPATQISGFGEVPAPARRPGFRIRYGRLGIAMLGLVGLLVVPVSAVALLFGAGSGFVPLVGLVVAAASVVALRFLAIRDRRSMAARPLKRVPAPLREVAEISEPQRPSAPVFDAEPAASREPTVQLSLEELRSAARDVARGSGTSKSAEKVEKVADAFGEQWAPVEVPKPSYVGSAKAERPAPAPLDLPESPKPEGRPLLQPGSSSGTGGVATRAQLPRATGALGNLDAVLQRRRA